MDKEIAEKVLAISTGCSRDTNESIRQVMQECDEETFKMYRRYGGKIMGYLFTELIAPIQSEHPELAPPEFEPMQLVERSRLRLTKETYDNLLALLTRLYGQIEAIADFVRENCDKVEATMYRSRINEVLVHVAGAMACVLAAQIEERRS